MKRIKNFTQFINENWYNSTGVSYSIGDEVWYGIADSEEEMKDIIVSNLKLEDGSIQWRNDYFEVSGTTHRGEEIYCSQSGDFDKINQRPKPKFGKPTAQLDDENILPQIKRLFKKSGWQGQIDISRTDIWGSVIY